MKTYDLLFSVSGIADPTTKTLHNDIADPTWSRLSTGKYKCLMTGMCPQYRAVTNYSTLTRIVDAGDNHRFIVFAPEGDGDSMTLTCVDESLDPQDLEANHLRLTINLYPTLSKPISEV